MILQFHLCDHAPGHPVGGVRVRNAGDKTTIEYFFFKYFQFDKKKPHTFPVLRFHLLLPSGGLRGGALAGASLLQPGGQHQLRGMMHILFLFCQKSARLIIFFRFLVPRVAFQQGRQDPGLCLLCAANGKPKNIISSVSFNIFRFLKKNPGPLHGDSRIHPCPRLVSA